MLILAIVFLFMVLLGSVTLAYQVFQLVVLDAESRGLKHPKLWGLFSIGSTNSGGGLILYLLGRNKYPSNISDDIKLLVDSRKKRAGLSLGFIAVGLIGLIFSALSGNL